MIVQNLYKRPVKLILTWNGVDAPFRWIAFDAVPEFDFVLFNYSGNQAVPESSNQYQYDALINIRTEFKGSILDEVYKHFKEAVGIDYIGLMDDDIQIAVSSINLLLATAYENKLDAFQAAVDPTCYHSFKFNEHQPGRGIQLVHWVEIMSPFYRKVLFDAAHAFYETSISSYGIDNYVMPFYQKVLGFDKIAIVNAVSMKHLRPVTDGSKIFSNGLTARQEGENIRKRIVEMIKKESTDLFSATYLKEVYGVGTLRWKIRWNLFKDWAKTLNPRQSLQPLP